MILASTKHIGQRMEVARNWSGKSKPDLALALGIGPVTYERYERGERSQLDKLGEIADALSVTKDYLLAGPLPLVPASKLSYRRRQKIKSGDSRHVQSVASVVPQFENLIGEYVDLPKVTVPNVEITEGKGVEEIVFDLRRGLGMPDAPLRSAIDLAESMGVLVFWASADNETFDGVSFWANERPFIVLNSRNRDGYRMRFTVLHELCHLICHRKADDTDQLEEERKLRDKEADRFASAFLMPANAFARRFNRFARVGDLLEERRYWMSSCAAMVRRARDLRLVDEDQYRRMCVAISKNGWRKGEPGAAEPERSRVHSFFLDEAGDKGLTPPDLAKFAAVPLGWFREAFPQCEAYQQAFTFEGL